MESQGLWNIILPSINDVLTEQVVHFFQILFLFTNNTSGDSNSVADLCNMTKELREELGVKIVPVAIGENAYVDSLRKIASMPYRAISCGLNEDPSKLGCKLLRGKYSIAYFFMRI